MKSLKMKEKRKVPRFKKERTAKIVLLIGKIYTVGLITMLTYPLVLFLTEVEMSQETWFLYLGGIFAGVLAAKIKLMGKVDKTMNKWIMILSLSTMMLVVNLLMNIDDKALLTIMALLAGIPTYTNIKYTFKDLEDDLKKHYNNNSYNSYNI